jgi:hypothetical protein
MRQNTINNQQTLRVVSEEQETSVLSPTRTASFTCLKKHFNIFNSTLSCYSFPVSKILMFSWYRRHGITIPINAACKFMGLGIKTKRNKLNND